MSQAFNKCQGTKYKENQTRYRNANVQWTLKTIKFNLISSHFKIKNWAY